jgi:hypothetical protein
VRLRGSDYFIIFLSFQKNGLFVRPKKLRFSRAYDVSQIYCEDRKTEKLLWKTELFLYCCYCCCKSLYQRQQQHETIKEWHWATATALLAPPSHTEVATERTTPPVMVKVGTTEMIRYIVELRGPLALFQSADITFLASLVFGSFGFGATELFRRSFTAAFVSDSSNSSESELVLLIAASLATVLTALAASPFEVLRVRSMGLVTLKPWTDVLKDFLVRCVVYNCGHRVVFSAKDSHSCTLVGGKEFQWSSDDGRYNYKRGVGLEAVAIQGYFTALVRLCSDFIAGITICDCQVFDV